jgi:hypothetical protein
VPSRPGSGAGAGSAGPSSSTHRGGTLAYLAAYDPHAARVLRRTAPTTGIIRSDSWSSR